MLAVEFRHDRRQIIIPAAIFGPAIGLNHLRVDALIDTGASISGISRTVAEHLLLPRQGKQLIATARGEQMVPLYPFRLGFYAGSATLPIVGERVFIGIECSPGARFQALIGMDVIGRSRLELAPDGTGIFAPSID